MEKRREERNTRKREKDFSVEIRERRILRRRRRTRVLSTLIETEARCTMPQKKTRDSFFFSR